MLGAIIGDIAGSRFEFNNMFDYGFELFSDKCSYTDDTIVGSLAEARWPVPYWMMYRAMSFLPEEMWYIYDQFRMKARRWVVTKNFFRPVNTKNTKRDSALYQNELGWCSADYHDAMTTDPERILRYYLEMGYDLYLFDTVTLRWYCIDNRYENRITLSKLRPKENWDGEYYEDSQGSVDWIHYNDIPDVIFKCKTVDQFLRGAAIDGTPIS